MITKIEGTCQYEGCDQPATRIASGQRSYRLHKKLEPGQYPTGCYCDDHAYKVVDFDHPEYHDNCPNCGCLFGVN